MKIIQVLEEVSHMEINLSSESAREFIADKILDALENNNRKTYDWEKICFPQTRGLKP
jgi:hypothetical protein